MCNTDYIEKFSEVMNYRFACKLYDTEAPLTKSETDFILEAGRLSPSSFGFEPWHFFAVQSIELREKLYHACFDQDAVKTAPLTVVIACLRGAAYDPDGIFVEQRGCRFPGTIEEFREDFRGYHDFLKEKARLDHWSRSQSYIACGNMMTAAAFAGIESCAIEGFNEEKLMDALGLDNTNWEIGIAMTFGHRAENVREKIREPAEKIITYL